MVTAVKRSLVVIIAIAVIGVVLLVSSGTALATRCPAGSPYASSATTLEACGMHISPLRGIKPLPGGGKEYTYEEPSGAPFSMNVPPASFDARSASASELATYGIPPEPPASSPEHAIWKEMISQGIKFATPPPFIAEAPPSSSSPDVPGAPAAEKSAPVSLVSPPSGSVSAQTKIWSGYFDWNGKGTYTHSTGYYIEPKTTSSCEKPIVAESSASYIWAGIGGWGGNPDLGQDGTAQHEEGLGEDEAWYEILPAQKHPKGLGLKAIGGKYMEADTHYENGEYKFYVHNFVPEGKSAYGHGSGPIDANVNDFIIERPGKENLLDFGNVTFQGFTNNKAFGENKTERLAMENGRGEVNAAPSQISSKYEFHDVYKDCNGLGEEEGEGGAAAEGPLPVTTTKAASLVSESGATLHASINPEGFDTRYHFEYGTEAENYGASTPSVDAGAGTTTLEVSSAITGLQSGTTYHYRIIADSATGTSAGADTTFTTTGHPPPPPPTVTTEGASGIGSQTAALEVAVNPNGLDTHYYFEYGTTSTLYENDAPAPPGNDAGSGSTSVRASVELTALTPDITYYYRTVASNSTGTSYGAQREFTTTAPWSIQTTQNPLGELESDQLLAVSCWSPTGCAAAGEYVNAAGIVATLIEYWNGTAWEVQATPNVAGAQVNYLDAISCSSSTACTATGYSETSPSAGFTLAERWNGTAWKVETTPNPVGSTGSELTGVSCSSSTACTAVGGYSSGSGSEAFGAPLAERWNGTTWTIESVPIAAGASKSEEGHLSSVSCSSSTTCMAAGSYGASSGGRTLTLAESWNGTVWKVLTTTNPSSVSWGDALYSLSCSASTACTAVGEQADVLSSIALVERWNGTAWKPKQA